AQPSQQPPNSLDNLQNTPLLMVDSQSQVLVMGTTSTTLPHPSQVSTQSTVQMSSIANEVSNTASDLSATISMPVLVVNSAQQNQQPIMSDPQQPMVILLDGAPQN